MTFLQLHLKTLFKLPDGFMGSPDDYLRILCLKMLQVRYGIDAESTHHTEEEQRILDRLEHELEVIASGALANKLLVLWDYVWDVGKGTWRIYQAGHGTLPGSLVAYLLPLTDVDPVKYDLIFEGFIDQELSNGSGLNIDEPFDGFGKDCLGFFRERYGEDTVMVQDGFVPRDSGQDVGHMTWRIWRQDRFVADIQRFYKQLGESAMLQRIPDEMKVFEFLRGIDGSFFAPMMPNAHGKGTKGSRKDSTEYWPLVPLLKKTDVRSIEDIAACYSLTIPGLCQFRDDFILRRNGKRNVTYEMPELEPILKETHGIILYQEQIMRIAHLMAGLSMKKASVMRRSLLRRMDVEHWHGVFVERAHKRGLDNKVCERLWQSVLLHSQYAFPKAHAIARAQLLYRIAYIRVHHLLDQTL